MNTHIRNLLAAAVLAGSAAFAQAQTILISESFGGAGGDNLNGTAADTFSSAIVAAGGSATWRASAGNTIHADGSISSSGDGAAYLNLGTYINDARGTADGLFTLTATVAKPTAGSWVSVGFFKNSANDNSLSGYNFTQSQLGGYATAFHRTNDGGTNTNFAAGPESANAFNPGNLTGTVTFKIELDFTTAGGYNGTNNFGTVRFYNPADLNSVSFSYTYTSAAASFTGIGITYAGSVTGGVDSFTLTQAVIPEPSAYAVLGGLGALGLAAWRRRRAG